MKKIISFSTFCIIISVILSSCGSNTSLTKRHYSKGYYVAHTKGKHKVVTKNKDEKIAHLKIKEASVTEPKKENSHQISIVEHKDLGTIQETTPLVASSNRTPIVFNTHIVSKHPIKYVSSFNLFPVKEAKHTIFSKKRVSPVSHDGHLSLFWIVILVLLVLWALGLLGGGFGLGIFINVLLIIALILLILWLLRIV